VARGFSGNPKHLAKLIARAIRHEGYALVDVLQPCVIFNRINTYDWYRDRVYLLDDDPSYDPSNYDAAWQKAHEWGDRIPLGVIYEVKGEPSYEAQVPALKDGPIATQELRPMSPEQAESLLAQFR